MIISRETPKNLKEDPPTTSILLYRPIESLPVGTPRLKLTLHCNKFSVYRSKYDAA